MVRTLKRLNQHLGNVEEMTDRANGYYWIRINPDPGVRVAQFMDGLWLLPGFEMLWPDSEGQITTLGEKIEVPPLPGFTDG